MDVPAQLRFSEYLPPHMRELLFEPTYLSSNGGRGDKLGPMREEVIARRAAAISGCVVEILVSVTSMALYDLRRSVLIPILNITLTILSGIGLSGALTLTLQRIRIHGVITTGLIAACLLNFLAEAFLTRTGMATGTMPGWLVLILLCAPYSVNLVCSMLSLALQASLSELLELDEQTCGLLSTEQLEAQATQMRGQDTCCVCMDKKKDAVITPCGHRSVCLSCGETLKQHGRKCPVCRGYITSVVRVFDT